MLDRGNTVAQGFWCDVQSICGTLQAPVMQDQGVHGVTLRIGQAWEITRVHRHIQVAGVGHVWQGAWLGVHQPGPALRGGPPMEIADDVVRDGAKPLSKAGLPTIAIEAGPYLDHGLLGDVLSIAAIVRSGDLAAILAAGGKQVRDRVLVGGIAVREVGGVKRCGGHRATTLPMVLPYRVSSSARKAVKMACISTSKWTLAIMGTRWYAGT